MTNIIYRLTIISLFSSHKSSKGERPKTLSDKGDVMLPDSIISSTSMESNSSCERKCRSFIWSTYTNNYKTNTYDIEIEAENIKLPNTFDVSKIETLYFMASFFK